MDMNSIFAKTAAGTDEVQVRSRKLPPRLRTVLILADGTRNGEQLQGAAASLGAPADAVQILFDLGLIASAGAQPSASPVGQAPTVPALLAAQQPLGEPAASPVGTDTERFRVAQKFMNDTAVDTLGFRAFFFTLKLEKCYTREDLLALMPVFVKAVGKASGAQVAGVLQTRARELLG